MRGIYAIADQDGRVYYIGRSQQIDMRAWDHLAKIKQDRLQYKKTKMYLLLQDLTKEVELRCYAIVESLMRIDLRKLEKEYIIKFKPILNTLVPSGCEKYIDKVETAEDVIKLAGLHGYWPLEEFRRIW